MHQVKRAIIMAAGTGTRMHPVTLTTPKPLVKVNGQAMIESVIEALHKNNIYEIHIVIGYLKEQFYALSEKYENLHFIENPYYDTCNNISSLYVAREYLEDVIILDGDQIIYDPSILKKEFNRSGYNVIYSDHETDEWVLEVDKDGLVTSCSDHGASQGWQLYSISRWNAKDGQQLKKHLEYEFNEKQNRQVYWDNVALLLHPQEYQLGITPMNKNAVIEIDNFYELCAMDPSYSTYEQEETHA